MPPAQLFMERIEWSTMTPDSHPTNSPNASPSTKKPSRTPEKNDDPFLETNLASSTSRLIKTPLGFALKPTAEEFKPRIPPPKLPRVQIPKLSYTTPKPKFRARDKNPECDLSGLQISETPKPLVVEPHVPFDEVFEFWKAAKHADADASGELRSHGGKERQILWDVSWWHIPTTPEIERAEFVKYMRNAVADGEEWTKYVIWPSVRDLYRV